MPRSGSFPRTLDDLLDGERALIGGFAASLAENRRQRFQDLGLIAGTEVAREKCAPLGDPVAYRLRGGILCLRRAEARLIVLDGA